MFTNLIRWFKGPTSEEYLKIGYDWAKKEIESGRLTKQMILDRCECPFDGPHPMDKGACQYIYELEGAENVQT